MGNWKWFFGEASAAPLIDPQTLIRPLPQQIQVKQTAADAWRLQWPVGAERVKIHACHLPDSVARRRLVAEVCDACEVTVRGLDTAVRHFFTLVFYGGPWDGRVVTVATRDVSLQKGVNFRDVGGYRTNDGRVVRWGKLYRSGTLARLTEADRAYLQRMGMRLVCDLRSRDEAAKYPNPLPAEGDVHYNHLPVDSLDRLSRLRGLATVLFRRHQLDQLLLKGYTQVMLTENKDVIGTVFRCLADPKNLPAVIHCTAGKDRTGVVIALLLLALGVPEETVIADYTQSNRFYRLYRAGLQADVRPLQRLGITPDDFQDLLLVKAETLQQALAFVRQEYGSVDNYLRQAVGLSNSTFSRLKTNLLIPEF